MRKMSDEEISTLAKDLVHNKVFMSDQLRNPAHVSLVFLSLSFLTDEIIEDFKKNDICHFYEYYDKMSGKNLNNMPLFGSCFPISKEDYVLVKEKEGKIRKAIEEAANG